MGDEKKLGKLLSDHNRKSKERKLNLLNDMVEMGRIKYSFLVSFIITTMVVLVSDMSLPEDMAFIHHDLFAIYLIFAISFAIGYFQWPVYSKSAEKLADELENEEPRKE